MNEISIKEKKSLAYLISALIILTVYMIYVFVINSDTAFDSNTNFSFYGITVLCILPTMIATNIVVHIILGIIHKISTNEDYPMLTDELDKMVELKANQNAYLAFTIGFMTSMILLAFNLPAHYMLNVQAVSILLASIVWSTSSLIYYKRGF